jgi:hypothetical protein
MAICADQHVQQEFFSVLFDSNEVRATAGLNAAVLERLELAHREVWLNSRMQYRVDANRASEYRLTSLQNSYAGRKRVLDSQLADTTDIKLKRMREAQLARLDVDYTRQTDELRQSMDSADIHTTLFAHGLLIVKNGE